MQLGKYAIIEELGKGGFGIVYKAHDTVLNVDRALKVLHPALVTDETFLERFKHEAQYAARLEHPNLVPVYDFAEAEGRYFLAMKYMPGKSLKDLLREKGKLGEKEALRIFEQVCAGVAYAHQQGVIHRDLKPGNILMDEDGSARVSDMGFAKAISGSTSVTLSATGAMIGTPSYMAPEMWHGKPATQAADQYSLACILVEMLTGQVLFDGETTPTVMLKHFEALQLPEELPARLRSVLTKALDKQPEKRYASIEDFKRALIAGGEEPPIPKVHTEQPKPSQPAQEETPTASSASTQTVIAPKSSQITQGKTPAALPASTPAVSAPKPSTTQTGSYPYTSAPFKAYPPIKTEPKKGSPNWMAVGGAAAIVLLCLLSIIGISVLIRNAGNRGTTISPTITPTHTKVIPTPTTPPEINNVLPYGTKFSMGTDSIPDTCTFTNDLTSVSQEEIFKDEWIYLSWDYNQALEDQGFAFSLLFIPDQETLYDDDLYIDQEKECNWMGFSLEGAQVGTYQFTIKNDAAIIYQHLFEVTYSDLSLIPRPDRDPLGPVSVGRDSVYTEICEIANQTLTVSVSELAEDEWFYFVIPFQITDVGKQVSFEVIRPDDTLLYESSSRTIEDNIDLCFWQGFSLEDEPPGKYILKINIEGLEEKGYTITIKE